jgi:hypothetical protein
MVRRRSRPRRRSWPARQPLAASVRIRSCSSDGNWLRHFSTCRTAFRVPYHFQLQGGHALVPVRPVVFFGGRIGNCAQTVPTWWPPKGGVAAPVDRVDGANTRSRKLRGHTHASCVRIWWIQFREEGRRVRESLKTTNRKVAEDLRLRGRSSWRSRGTVARRSVVRSHRCWRWGRASPRRCRRPRSLRRSPFQWRSRSRPRSRPNGVNLAGAPMAGSIDRLLTIRFLCNRVRLRDT